MNVGHNSAGHFDGSTAARAVPPTHVASLCEQMGCSEESTSEQFVAAVKFYIWEWEQIHTDKMLARDAKMGDVMLLDIMAARHPIHPGCCVGHTGLVIDLELAGLL